MPVFRDNPPQITRLARVRVVASPLDFVDSASHGGHILLGGSAQATKLSTLSGSPRSRAGRDARSVSSTRDDVSRVHAARFQIGQPFYGW